MKAARKKKKKIVKHKSNISRLLPIFGLLALAVLVAGYLYYQSRAVPDLHEENQITEYPSDLKSVLGANSNTKVAQGKSMRVPILMYHYIEYVEDKKDTIRQSLNVTPNVLKAQIETLKEAGYSFVTPSDLTKALDGKAKNFPKKPIILSFDDGYKDFYTDAYPILKEEKVKAIVYVIVNFLDRPNFMFTFQLKEVAKDPMIEIGAHTMDHLALKGMAIDKARYQIRESRKELQKMLNLPINSFAYPYGSLDQQAIDLVREAGFIDAASTIPDIKQTEEAKYYLYRLRAGYRNGQELLTFLDKDTFKAW